MKKMRKLLPAFAMLLVSAIMMSTASFAWFTMNETVTATGMSVQAKATGSLVVDSEELTYESAKTKVDFTTATAPTLKPITWDEDAWKVADGNNVDPFTGKLTTGDLEAPAPMTASEYFVDKVIYIGAAGDTLTNQQLTINLRAVTSSVGEAYKAYSVAIYVINPGEDYWEDTATLPISANSADLEPVAVIHADTLKETADATYARNTVVLRGEGTVAADGNTYYAGYTIPSIVGVDGDNTTGLKVVIRIFVDGNLDALSANGVKAVKQEDVVSYPLVAADAKFVEGTTYYTDENGTVANLYGYEAGDDIPDTWRTRVETPTDREYKYINSADVPMTASTLEVSFTAAKEPQYVAP